MHNEKLRYFTKIILDIMFWSGAVIEITAPVWLNLAGKYYSSSIKEYYFLMLVVFMSAGLCGIMIVNELRKMMRTVLSQNAFVKENVNSLKKMSKLSAAICLFFVIKVIFFLTPATLIIVLVFFIAALFSAVLSGVFLEAINYKEENDLTI